MKRRTFGKIVAITSLSSPLKRVLANPYSKFASKVLPEVTDNGNSVERCINSRYSFHSGYTATLPHEVVANILWAASSAPLIADERKIYAATSDNLYLCSKKDDVLQLDVHASGDKRVDSSSALQVGISTTPEDIPEDAGVALHLAQLASVASWKSTVDQPACLPSEAAWNIAKTSWNTLTKLHLVSCFGLSKSVKGLKYDCVAVSSDKTLPDPKTDGIVSFEAAIKKLSFGTEFTSDDLTKEEVSQLLWASYGVTPHTVIGGNNAANAVASHTAQYFLSGKIYLVSSIGVQRYQIRKTPKDLVNRDHRLEEVKTGDARTALRSVSSKLPQNAPAYIIFCGSKIEAKQQMEAGFAGAGALLQATAMGLQGHYAARFTDAERAALQAACGIPAADLPILVFSAGHVAGTGKTASKNVVSPSGTDFSAMPLQFRDHTIFNLHSTTPINGELCIYDELGKIVRRIRVTGKGGTVRVRWDGCDRHGNKVATGAYSCVMTYPSGKAMVKVTKLR